MWSTWAFCEVVHISTPTPYLSIKHSELFSNLLLFSWLLMDIIFSEKFA